MLPWKSNSAKEQKYGAKWESHKLVGGGCGQCGKTFGLLAARHHCRKCGTVICGECQHPERMIVSGSTNPKIVCQVCAVELQGGTTKCDMSLKSFVTGYPGQPAKMPTCCEDEDDGVERRCAVDDELIEAAWAERDGQIYCAEHYAELFCETCRGCSQKVCDEPSVEALGNHWHRRCFVCAWCSEPLNVDSAKPSSMARERLDTVRSEFDCSYDSLPARGISTMSCGLVVESNTFGSAAASLAPISADSKLLFSFYWHNGSVYCARDYLEHMKDKCPGCGFKVDSGPKVLGACWHQECLVCFECKEPFAQMSPPAFYFHHGQMYCQDHTDTDSEDVAHCRTMLHSLPSMSPRSPRPTRTYSMAEREDLNKGTLLSLALWKCHESDAMSSSFETGTASSRLELRTFHNHRQLSFASECEELGDGIEGNMEVFAHDVFKDLRQNAFGVSESQYRDSLGSRPLTGGTVGEGKSGNLFFFSWDKKYIVKTVDPEEEPFFRTCLKDYHRHMLQYSEECSTSEGEVTRSFLPRYLGYYTLKMKREPVLLVVVMANVFPHDCKMKETYDLKGVMGAKRFVSEDEQLQGVSVLKDRNFIRSLAVGRTMKEDLLEQLGYDVKFLQDHGRMDYSLLLGISPLSDVAEKPGCWPNTDCNGLPSSDASEVFFMGIIDILEEYTMKKAVEGTLKRFRHEAIHLVKTSKADASKDTAVSSCSASQYGRRFHEFLKTKMV